MSKSPRGPQPVGRRAQVLHVLRDGTEPVSIAEIAERLGVHANTVRFHLDTLVANGQVECRRAEPGTPGRPRQLFQAVRGMDPMGPRHYRVLAEALAATLATDPDPSRRATEAGRVWGRLQASAPPNRASSDGPGSAADAVESVDLLTQMLDELGFAPEQAGGGRSQIGLRNCPFLELAIDRSEVVCPVHLGLMQGAMQTWASPVTVDRLDPFVEPDLCMVHLGAVGAS
ncbi:MAG: helix-turn-helix transcriptional regulator [Propionibacteriaceae bacterium]